MNVIEKNLVKKFRKIASEMEVRALLQKAADQRARCTYWIQPSEEPQRVQVEEYLANQNIFILKDFKTPSIELRVLVSVFLKNAAVLCFRGTPVPLSDNVVGIIPDREVFEIQRRQELRIPISKGYEINLKWVDTKIKKEMLVSLSDLSPHGVSFIAASEWAEKWDAGEVIDRVLLLLRQKKIVFSFEIENKTQLNADTWRMGASIVKINESDSAILSDYVSEQAVLNFLPGSSARVRSK